MGILTPTSMRESTMFWLRHTNPKMVVWRENDDHLDWWTNSHRMAGSFPMISSNSHHNFLAVCWPKSTGMAPYPYCPIPVVSSEECQMTIKSGHGICLVIEWNQSLTDYPCAVNPCPRVLESYSRICAWKIWNRKRPHEPQEIYIASWR